MSSSRRPVVRVLAVAAWSLLAAIAGLIAIFQNTPMLNQSMLASSVDLEPAKMKPWGGLAYSHPSIWFGLGDNERSIRSGIVLSENGVELPQSKSLHADIRDRGAGAWSHWNRVILFST
ncbi:MAG: hypothetical protein FJ253_11715, partial [Phycisphaerae bacterium]|nr:hypothetical protein [Phycisphaerae bacterium]